MKRFERIIKLFFARDLVAYIFIHRVLLFIVAELAHESLPDDDADGGGEKERFNAHIYKARYGARRAVGVYRREDEVAG